MNEYIFSVHRCGFGQETADIEKDTFVLIEGLGRNILNHLGDVELGRSLRIFIRDQKNEVVGGIVGDLFGGWIYISLLWVEEDIRNQGYGSQLLSRLELEAIEMGCKYAHVDTYSFEARPFYERAGYKAFATLEDYPAGHCKYFMKKTLATEPAVNAERSKPE